MDVLFQAVDLVPKSTPFLTLNSNFTTEQIKNTVSSNSSNHNNNAFQNPELNGVVPYCNPPPRRTNTNPSTSAFRALNSLVHLSANNNSPTFEQNPNLRLGEADYKRRSSPRRRQSNSDDWDQDIASLGKRTRHNSTTSSSSSSSIIVSKKKKKPKKVKSTKKTKITKKTKESNVKTKKSPMKMSIAKFKTQPAPNSQPTLGSIESRLIDSVPELKTRLQSLHDMFWNQLFPLLKNSGMFLLLLWSTNFLLIILVYYLSSIIFFVN